MCVCVLCLHDARQSTVGVEFSIEIHGLIDKVLVGINYIVLTRLGWKKASLYFTHICAHIAAQKMRKVQDLVRFYVEFKLNTVVDDLKICCA